MKNTKKIVTLAFFSLLIFSMCRESQNELSAESKYRAENLGLNEETQVPENINNLSTSLNKNCDCSPLINSDCPDCIVNKLMQGKTRIIQSVSWGLECNNGCYIDPSNSSTIVFCYDPNVQQGECGLLTTIYGLPACLASCALTDSICIRSKVSCSSNGNDIAITGTYVGADSEEHTFDVSLTYGNDPKIKICCGKICCSGETR